MFGPGRALMGKWAGGKIGVGFVILHLPNSLIPFYITYSSAVTKNWSTFDGIMATKPGILTDWPWTPLGNFKVHYFFFLSLLCLFNYYIYCSTKKHYYIVYIGCTKKYSIYIKLVLMIESRF